MGGRYVGRGVGVVTQVTAGNGISGGGGGPVASLSVGEGTGVNSRSDGLDCFLLPFHFTASNSVASGVDAWRGVPYDCTITAVWVFQYNSGTTGALILDLLRGAQGTAPSTLYTTRANRPSIGTAGTLQVRQATLPDVVTLTRGDFLMVNVDQINTGGQDWVLIVFAEPR